MKKLNLKNEKGITLVALVVTIIILIILAGVSISLVLGENGILQKARTAKEDTEKAEIVENAKLDILAQITENKGENISKKQLADILNKQFESVDENSIPDEISAANDIELTTIDEKHKINLSKIYTGIFNEANSTKKLTQIITNSDYGKTTNYSVTVNGKTLNDWKVFLNDGNNVYIILGDYLEASLIPNSTGLTTYANHKYSVERSI